MSISIAHPPIERRRGSTLTGVVPPSSARPSVRKGSSASAPDRRLQGLESINEARATLARMLGSLELFALGDRDESGLESLRRDATSIATNLCAITAAFVSLAEEEERVEEPPASVARLTTKGAPSSGSREMRARLDHLCSFPVRTMDGFLSETSLALNKMAAAFMRVAGCIDLDRVNSNVGYDPEEDIRSFPRLLTGATAALQASDYELGHMRSHQRLLAAVLSALPDDQAVARAVEDGGELGPLGSFLKDAMDLEGDKRSFSHAAAE